MSPKPDAPHHDAPPRHRTRRQAVAALTVALCLGLPATAAVASPAVASTGPSSAAGSYLVRAEAGQLGAVSDALRKSGAHLGHRIALINTVVATLPEGRADALLRDSRVTSVTPNAPVSLLAGTYDAVADADSLLSSQEVTAVRKAWDFGITGAGIDVAVLDSGVAPVEGLAEPGKIVNGPDLTPESQNAVTRYMDTYGHGTHMAGIIAGHDTGVAVSSADTTSFLGVAPDARIVSVKVADARGNTDVSQVIAGIAWVVQHAKDPGMNIRVMNLSFGTNSSQSNLLDPLSFAVEQAWHAGIVVVTSAGNSGATTGRMTNPAMNPFVIAVGADDTKRTKAMTDDAIPAFSTTGDGVRNPDVIAPGVHVQSLRVPGSYVDLTYGATGRINERFMRGSGTSQAAAYVSGMAALLVSASPGLTADEVKASLKMSAYALPQIPAKSQGSGIVRVPSGIVLALGAVQTFSRSTGTGTLEGSRGTAHVIQDRITLTGEKDIHGKAFNATALALAQATRTSWTGGTWNGTAWAGSVWVGTNWSTVTWSGNHWAGKSWASGTWASGTWAGKSWADSNWAGKSWAGSTWAASGWAGKSWADNTWS